MKIVHKFRDGTVRDSIEGIVVPKECSCYQIIRDIQAAQKEVRKEKNRCTVTAPIE